MSKYEFRHTNLFGLDLTNSDLGQYEQSFFSFRRGVACGIMGMPRRLNPYVRRDANACGISPSWRVTLFSSWDSGWELGHADWVKASKDLDRQISSRSNHD